MRRARFEVYPDAKGEWRWRLVAANGRIIADGAEGYATASGANRAVGTVVSTIDREGVLQSFIPVERCSR